MSFCPREMIESSQTEDDLKASLRYTLEYFDIERFSFASFSKQFFFHDNSVFSSINEQGSNNEEHFRIFHTYSQTWIDHYTKEKYYLIDPVYTRSKEEYVPFVWRGNGFKECKPHQHKLFVEARDFNISKGLTLSFSSNLPSRQYLTILDHVNLNIEFLHIIRMASYDYLRKEQEFYVKKNLKNISSSDYLILMLTAEGVPQKTIAAYLNISEHALHFSIKKIRKKFNNASLHTLMFYLGLIKKGAC